MKNNKLITFILTIVLLISIAFPTLAYEETPCEVISELTGKSIYEIRNEHFNEHKSYTEIADEYDVLESYKAAFPNDSNYGRGTGCGYGYRQGRRNQKSPSLNN